MEEKPEIVSEETKQSGKIHARWEWVEPSVWTERMLTALEEGVKGGKWFSLIDKVAKLDNLRKAFARVKANGGVAGVDHQTAEMFEQYLEKNLEWIAQELREDNYQPKAIKRVWIPKAGSKEKRPLGIPTVRDRVVQTAMRQVIEPIFEAEFAEHSYGFRPKRGCKDALRRVDNLLKAGRTYVVDADLRKYFDTIPHRKLMERVETRVVDGKVLKLISSFLTQGVMEGMETRIPEEGSPQGAVISPLLSNLYLDPLDHLMAETGFEMVRYADDLVIMCESKAEAEEALCRLQQWTAEAGLSLHPEKTRIVSVDEGEGFEFLGYRFTRDKREPRRKSLNKIKDTIRSKTGRSNGQSLKEIILDVNRSLKGWFEYFKHSHYYTFTSLDGWIRMRLRSILRNRHGGKGCGQGWDHLRWTNAYFIEQGLFSLTQAYESISQSSKGANH
jgi:RNA-directed DNA polymerase